MRIAVTASSDEALAAAGLRLMLLAGICGENESKRQVVARFQHTKDVMASGFV